MWSHVRVSQPSSTFPFTCTLLLFSTLVSSMNTYTSVCDMRISTNRVHFSFSLRFYFKLMSLKLGTVQDVSVGVQWHLHQKHPHIDT